MGISGATGNMFGWTEKSILGTGKTIKCTERDCSHGLRADTMKESITWIRRKDTGSLCGAMGRNMKVSGKMANNMATGHSLTHQAKPKKVNGHTGGIDNNS